MAKITIAGDAVVITSAMKLEDLTTIGKYRPNALVLKGGEDGKEEIFRIGVGKGCGEINKYGATFSSESHDDAKLATITMTARVTGDDIREVIADEIGSAVTNLTTLEATLPAVLEAIKAERKAIIDSINVAQ